MEKINWGIIGCGDVTEIKSGPAFNKVRNSSLAGVMRRNREKAEDYARRHNVPRWYTNASELIHDPDINAIYVATPPSSHEEYAIAAMEAAKPVYLEKPMSVNAASAKRIAEISRKAKARLSIAHYRRAQPLFGKIKELINDNAIGAVRIVRSDIYKKSLSAEEMANPARAWRVDRSIAGGGLFNDLSPHQIDLMYYYFGEPESASGFARNQSRQYEAEDMVAGNILFRSGVLFSGIWSFNVAAEAERDSCEIIGDKGKISFSFFDHKPVMLTRGDKTESLVFDPLPHVQQPMIEKVVDYFLGRATNPCSADEGVRVMELIDTLAGN